MKSVIHSFERASVLALLLAATITTAPIAKGSASEDVNKIVAQMQTALGKDKWDQTRFVRFDFLVDIPGRTKMRARHLWDRSNGNYRVEWTSKDEKNLTALLNIQTREGQVFENGVATPTTKVLLDTAYQRFINDSYWLTAPLKLTEPGVHLESAGEKTEAGRALDIIHVHFDSVGLTPGDHYWFFVDKQTHRLDRWAFFLQSFEGPPALDKSSAWTWTGWEEINGIWLAQDRESIGRPGHIGFPVLNLPVSVPQNVFTDPRIPLP